MDNRSSNSRSSSRYSKSVVFPRIKTDPRYNKEPRNSHEHLGTDFYTRASSKIKEQDDDFNRYILERLDFTERALETERRERNVLEDHVRGLVANLQRVSKDVTTLQQQLNSGEYSAKSSGLKNVEPYQLSGMGEMWNRLTLGDLNTIKLSGDLNQLSGEVADLKRSQENSKQKLEKTAKEIETLVTKVEKFSLEFENKFQQLKGDLDSKVSNFEQTLKIVENRNEKVDGGHYLKQEVEEHYSQVLKHFELRFDEFVEKHESWKESVERRLLVLDEDLLKVKGATSINYEDLKRKMDDLRTNQKKALSKSHETVKDSYREAFRVVYESITTMQTVLEAKLKMTEADLKTSINSILRTISQ